MSEPTADEINAAAQKAVDGFLGEIGSDFGTGRFVLAVEVMAPDGERFLYSSVGEGMKAWESLGILQYLTQVEQAHAVSDKLDE